MKVYMKPIEVIAWFTKDGKHNPIKYRITNIDSNVTVKVDKIITVEEEKLAGNRMYIFRCQSLVNGVEKLYELKYELGTCRWYLFKI